MREISRHTEGLSKPPTLYIHLSFFLLLLPTSCALAFSQLIHFVFWFFLSFSFPVFPLTLFLFLPHLISCFLDLVLTSPPFLSRFFFNLHVGFAFLCSNVYNCRVEKSKEIIVVGGGRALGSRLYY